ncbi:NADH-quinone oxidoreductase subunit B family protein [Citrifermentans bremense]|nr:4Fe-4S dicluster domain-containing protein [Citrifermentans bremense]
MQDQVKETPAEPVRLFRINTGSCNGCDVELAVTAAVDEFDVEQLGCRYTEEPHEADILLITGPLTVRARNEALRLYAEAPETKVTVAVGVCPVSGGVFRDSYAVDGPVQRYLPVDLNVPGCPPRPQALLAGIAQARDLWRARSKGVDAVFAAPPLAKPADEPAQQFPIRGRMSFDPKACVDCRMCRHVCAAGAIHFDIKGDKGDRHLRSQSPGSPEGVRLTLWHNSCVFCGLCSHYCPTGALSVTGDWHLAHRGGQTFRFSEQGEVPYTPCSGCGSPLIAVAPELLHAAFRRPTPEIEHIKTLCPACRQQLSIGAVRR